MQTRSIVSKARRFFLQRCKKYTTDLEDKASFSELTDKAMAGCIDSQRTLGDYYYYDEIDIDLALYWYDKAALQDDPDAAIMAFSIEANDSRRKIASALILNDPQFNADSPQ